MRVTLGKAVAVERPREKGVFLFALLFVLVALCSLSLYYAQIGQTEGRWYGASGGEPTAVGEKAMPLGGAGAFRSEPATVVGLD